MDDISYKIGDIVMWHVSEEDGQAIIGKVEDLNDEALYIIWENKRYSNGFWPKKLIRPCEPFKGKLDFEV